MGRLPICPSSCFEDQGKLSSRFSGSNVNMQGPAGQHHACPCLGIDHRTTGVDPILPIGRYLGTVPTSTAASTASTAHCDCYDPAFAQFLHDAGCRSDSTLDQDSRDMTSGYLSHAHILAFSHSRILALLHSIHPPCLRRTRSAHFCSPFLLFFPPSVLAD